MLTMNSAAFGRLCVETRIATAHGKHITSQPPSGGCVLKQQAKSNDNKLDAQPPSGGCVLKLHYTLTPQPPVISRLRAAVC